MSRATTAARVRLQRIVHSRVTREAAEMQRDRYQRSVANTGMHTVVMPTLPVSMHGRTVIEASVGAVALVGENLGKDTWRRKRCYLGLFINPARRGS